MTAIEAVNISVDKNKIITLFSVNEAEAATAYALTSRFHSLKLFDSMQILFHAELTYPTERGDIYSRQQRWQYH